MSKQTAVEWLVEQVNKDCLNSTFIRKELIEKAKAMELEQTQISDELIEDAAKKFSFFSTPTVLFEYGAKWYRLQLRGDK